MSMLNFVSGVAIDKLVSKSNVRKEHDAQGIQDLANSIKAKGILQPIIAIKDGDNYEVLCGARRLEAAKSADLKEVPVLIKEGIISDEEKKIMQMIENIQRKNLKTSEKSEAILGLLDKKVSQVDLAKALGMSTPTISKYIKIGKYLKDKPNKKDLINKLGMEMFYNRCCVKKSRKTIDTVSNTSTKGGYVEKVTVKNTEDIKEIEAAIVIAEGILKKLHELKKNFETKH